jgi:hypothetical protein
MKREFAMINRLRRVFTATREGMGLATALVQTFGPADGEPKGVARMILLGLPPRVALEPIVGDGSRELSMLAGLLSTSSSSSTEAIGGKGERLSTIMERWLKMKEARIMEQRVMQMRSHLMSAVLGAVVAMLASLGPLVSNLNLIAGSAPQSSGLLVWSTACMVAISSGMLGLFMSGKRFYFDVILSLTTFAFVCYAVAPLASVPVVNIWGIK